MVKLDKIVDQGGEGLMLHRADAAYHTGRSNDLLKVKSYLDAEATVIAHLSKHYTTMAMAYQYVRLPDN